MKKKEIIKNAFYLLNEVSDLKYQLELEKLENKKLRKQLNNETDNSIKNKQRERV